ncbi:hypothetical protein SISNIDRAFT_465557 [Sistotremastrum niveocremeum HHB9708]|uniref:Uncharacterized protein n=1 Tax=Sistotremastrum niveocremeum HHB9708 TaxID=1314777 RepID=A0A164VAD1_9AGAM|nr:hypothetical protein SISNIDRAFT_465557 [Sistotremastrum niveocremeum HHB9708]
MGAFVCQLCRSIAEDSKRPQEKMLWTVAKRKSWSQQACTKVYNESVLAVLGYPWAGTHAFFLTPVPVLANFFWPKCCTRTRVPASPPAKKHGYLRPGTHVFIFFLPPGRTCTRVCLCKRVPVLEHPRVPLFLPYSLVSLACTDSSHRPSPRLASPSPPTADNAHRSSPVFASSRPRDPFSTFTNPLPSYQYVSHGSRSRLQGVSMSWQYGWKFESSNKDEDLRYPSDNITIQHWLRLDSHRASTSSVGQDSWADGERKRNVLSVVELPFSRHQDRTTFIESPSARRPFVLRKEMECKHGRGREILHGPLVGECQICSTSPFTHPFLKRHPTPSISRSIVIAIIAPRLLTQSSPLTQPRFNVSTTVSTPENLPFRLKTRRCEGEKGLVEVDWLHVGSRGNGQGASWNTRI